jgi:hypothetical protein
MTLRLTTALALLSAGVMTLMVVALAGAPIGTADFWFHLKAGEAYATEGPWPAADPMLHTAHEDAPVQHEWLFGVAIYGLERTIGFYGLRSLHAVAVFATAAMVLVFARRRLRSWALAACMVSLFLATGWARLLMLRPDLISIPAALLFAEWVFYAGEIGDRAWRRCVVAAAVLSIVWANAHSLFALGPALAIAALGAAGLDALLPGTSVTQRAAARKRCSRLAALLAITIVVTALNPRGFDQHLTFFTSSAETAIWAVYDEWQHFDPRRWASYGLALSPLAGLITNLTALVLMLVSLRMAWRFVASCTGIEETARSARPSSRELTSLALALAGMVAALVSIRFAWMEIFAWLHLAERAQNMSWLQSRPVYLDRTAASCAVVIACLFPGPGHYLARAGRLPDDVGSYLREPYNLDGFHAAGADFLEASGLEGKLFNRYTTGGYLGFRLAPRIRTFVDGRVEHYSSEVLADYFAITNQQRNGRGETALQALDRYGVDFYYGVGSPVIGKGLYTTPRVEDEPGWIQIFRSHDHSISMRRNTRNRENLELVARYYEKHAVPFSIEKGFDPVAALTNAPGWAMAAGVAPDGYSEIQDLVRSDDPEVRRAALGWLATLYFLLGAYEAQVELDRTLIGEASNQGIVRLRLTHGLLRLGRTNDALVEARTLVALAPSPLARAALAVGRQLSTGSAPARGKALRSILYTAPLFSSRELKVFFEQGRRASSRCGNSQFPRSEFC